jgi:hypothetical protein
LKMFTNPTLPAPASSGNPRAPQNRRHKTSYAVTNSRESRGMSTRIEDRPDRPGLRFGDVLQRSTNTE